MRPHRSRLLKASKADTVSTNSQLHSQTLQSMARPLSSS